MRRSVLALGAALLLGLTGAPPCRGEGGPGEYEGEKLYEYEGPRLTRPQPELESPFPDAVLPDAAGNAVRLSDYAGSVILLSFCSCYTDTCCAIIDALEDMKSDYAGRGIVTVIVCSEISPVLARDDYAGILAQCAEAADTLLIDEGGKVKGRFEIRKLPTTFLLDTAFRVQYKVTSAGALYTKSFRRRVEDALREEPQGDGR